MIALALRNLLRRPLRNGLTLAGIATASSVLICIVSFGRGYGDALRGELDRAGVQMMLVPLGCPYDAAARVLKNNTLENSLPLAALEMARKDPAVAVAAPLLTAAVPRQNERRTDLWVGLDVSALSVKPWWKARSGRAWFQNTGEVILGADAALIEMRLPGEKLFSPETGREFRVAGVLERSGTSDDSAFFIPLSTAQEMFHQSNRLTAVIMRLKEPSLAREAAPRLQKIPGAQVVTLNEMMGTFLNLLGAVRTLVLAIAFISVAVSMLSVFNTLFAAVIERAGELAVMRAIGAARIQIFILLILEAFLLSVAGIIVGAASAFLLGPEIEDIVKDWAPFAPSEPLLRISFVVILRCAALALFAGTLAAMLPAWRAARLQPALASRNE